MIGCDPEGAATLVSGAGFGADRRMICINAATTANLPDIRRLHTESWRDAYARFVPGAALARLESEMAERWSALPGGVLCARSDVQIVGFVRVKRRQGWPYIDNLHTLPAQRGGGIGAALLHGAAAWLRDRDEGRVWLTVIEGNVRARAFYARHGGIEGAALGEKVLGHPLKTRPVIWNRLGPLLAKF